LFPVDLAHDPDSRPHGPLANHPPEGDRLPASALDTTAQVHMIRERGEASAQNPNAFEAQPALAWYRGGQEGPCLDGDAEALLALQDALLEDGLHEQPRVDHIDCLVRALLNAQLADEFDVRKETIVQDQTRNREGMLALRAFEGEVPQLDFHLL